MEQKFSFGQKMRYKFENTLSKGTIALITWLGIISVFLMIVGAVILSQVGITPDPTTEPMVFFEAFWQSLVRTVDAGAFGADNGWSFRFIMFAITLGGIFIFSALIGVLNSGLESSLDDLRKGKSKVIEKNHTLILGWSTTVFNIISELLLANENQKQGRIVIMADKDKVEMEDEIRMNFPKTGNSKIICRTGSPLNLVDIDIVNFNEAKSIIIVSPEAENPDINVIKSVLAITNNPKRKQDKFHIVAEIREMENLQAAKLVGGDEACYVLTNDLIARITAQTCRQSGLSIIYTELLDYGGDEIYFKEEKSLAGKTYKDVLNSYDTSAIMGVMKKDKTVLINPPMDTRIDAGDQVIAVSADDDTVVPSGIKDLKVDENAIYLSERIPQKKEKNLILGWNGKGHLIVQEFDNYVLQGSEMTIVTESDTVGKEIEELKGVLKNLTITLKEGNITDRDLLDSLNVPSYNEIIVLGYHGIDIQEADAKTLITLLHLRNMSEQCNKHFNIVSEMFDVRNRELAMVTKADDFIVGDNLISLMISQLSENKYLKNVFDILFAAEGSEIYLKPIVEYVKPGSQINFYTLVEAAARRGETALGYRLRSEWNDAGKQFGVHLNPKKSDIFTVSAADRIIVLAEN